MNTSKLRAVLKGHKGFVAKLTAKLEEVTDETEVEENENILHSLEKKLQSINDLHKKIIDSIPGDKEDEIDREVIEQDNCIYILQSTINKIKKTIKDEFPTASGGQHLDSTPIYNPAVPFVYKNLKDVVPGKIFYISGIPFQDPTRISINFERRQDVAYHFDIRFCFCDDRNVIVRNSRLNNRWGQRESTLNRPFPFKEDEFFDIMILIESASFKVAINNHPVLEFMHRIPFRHIDTLRITGEVRLCQVRP